MIDVEVLKKEINNCKNMNEILEAVGVVVKPIDKETNYVEEPDDISIVISKSSKEDKEKLRLL